MAFPSPLLSQLALPILAQAPPPLGSCPPPSQGSAIPLPPTSITTTDTQISEFNCGPLKLYIKALTPAPQNMTLFENRVIAHVIS